MPGPLPGPAILFRALGLCGLLILWGAGCAGNAPGRAAAPRNEPAWVSDVDQVYSRLRYLAAVGYGPSRDTAEKEALAALIAVFGQTVQADRHSVVRYAEALQQDMVSSYIRDTEITNAINTSAELDTLIGAELRDYWYDDRGTHYAAAVMEKSRARSLYSGLLNANREIIRTLVTMNDEERYSLDGCARYLLAAKIAGGSRTISNILAVVEGAGASPGMAGGLSDQELAQPENFRLEALAIARHIPVELRVDNDGTGRRLYSAFARVIEGKGFVSGGRDSRYALEASLTLNPVDLPGQQNQFVRYELNASLVDRRTGNVLVPYHVSGREGHLTRPEAENRAIAALERHIAETWDAALSAYLDSLMPSRR
jgi:hypothetical protein